MRNMLAQDVATVLMSSLRSQLNNSLVNGLVKVTKCSMKSAFIKRNIQKNEQNILE